MIPTLRLTVTEPDSIPAQDRVRAVTGTVLRIGREADNDWILTDPARRMSRHHCTIDFQGGVYVVIDTSANGVFHNDATRPLGRGSSRILSDGDVLRFPGVTLAVALIEDSDARDAFRAVLPPRRGGPAAGAAVDPLDDLLAQPAASWGADPLDDTALPEAPDAGLPFGAGPFSSLSLATSAIDGSALSWSQERRAAPPQTQAAWSRLGVGDRSEPEHQAFSSSLPGQAVIPEDWDLDAPHAAVPPPGAAGPANPPPPAPAAEIPSDWSDEAPEPPRPVAARLAPPGPVPIPVPVPASGDEALLLALVAALARIERALLGPDVGLMQGPAETVLRRLRATEPSLADRAIALIAERAAERIDAPSEDPMVSRQAATAPSRPGDDA